MEIDRAVGVEVGVMGERMVRGMEVMLEMRRAVLV